MLWFQGSTLLPRVCRCICTLSASELSFQMNETIRRGELEFARKLFDENLNSQNVLTWNAMIAGYVKYNQFNLAQELFDKMPARDIVSWNTMLSGFQRTKKPTEAYEVYMNLRALGFQPTEYTLSILISTVLDSVFRVLIPQLHAYSLRTALNSSVFVGSALIGGYVGFGDFSVLSRVFDEIVRKDVTSWNALVSGYMDLGLMKEAETVFIKMPEKNVVSSTIMVCGYLKNNRIKKARSVFDNMKERNATSWTVMISGYVQTGSYSQAFELFSLMGHSRTQPSQFTFSSILDACAGCPSLSTGEQIHAHIIKHGIPFDPVLYSSLIDMYAKCGNIEGASYVFSSMSRKSLSSWNSIVGGYARNGQSLRALAEFDMMASNGINPDRITMVNVLSACGHGGLVGEGERVFNSMRTLYGVEPDVEHYACMVDLYGRAGHLVKAERLIEEMPIEPDLVVWGALLGACGMHSDFAFGSSAAEAVYRLQKDHPCVFLLLSKMLGEKGMWNSVIELRSSVEMKHSKKQKAGSWIS